jgi:folate-dependent phosphoribosylglycinamide formyltransferase PurN
MTKIAILSSENNTTVESLLNHFQAYQPQVFNEISPELSGFDFVLGVNFALNNSKLNIINTHYSLLPSFDNSNPLQSALLEGVKVSGITFYYTNPRKIIAQYPVLITNEKHFDDVELEMRYLEQTIYPLIVEKIINNEQFDIQQLLKRNNCGGCSKGCHKGV